MSKALCDLCHFGTARFVCLECGFKVCYRCFDEGSWLCIQCLKKVEGRYPPAFIQAERKLLSLTMKLFIAGFAIMAIGIVLMVVASLLKCIGAISGGLIIFIGPLPIALGAGPYSEILILIGVLIAALMILIAFITFRRGFKP